MAAGTSTPPMAAGAPFTYGGYVSTPTAQSPGATTLTKVRSPPKYVKHARYLPDVEHVLQDVERFFALEDNRGFIEAVKNHFLERCNVNFPEILSVSTDILARSSHITRPSATPTEHSRTYRNR